jgi:hypothetical protein
MPATPWWCRTPDARASRRAPGGRAAGGGARRRRVVDPSRDEDVVEKVKEKTKHRDGKKPRHDGPPWGRPRGGRRRDGRRRGEHGRLGDRARHATGDAVAVGGSVIARAGARVDGDAVAVGGTVEVKPGATLGGQRTAVGGAFGKVLSGAGKLSPARGRTQGTITGQGFLRPPLVDAPLLRARAS